MSYTVLLMDCPVSADDRRDAESTFCAALEVYLGGAAQVAAAYRAYDAAFKSHEETPLPPEATDAERAAVRLWEDAERAATQAAFDGWHGVSAGTMRGAHFEISAITQMNFCPVIAFEGHWEDVTRKQFPDLSGAPEGNVIAVDAPGHGVLVGSSCDPAYYMLTLGKRYKAKGVNFGTVLVSVPVTDSYAHARAIFYALTGQRSVYASLVERSFDDVRLAVESHLNPRRSA